MTRNTLPPTITEHKAPSPQGSTGHGRAPQESIQPVTFSPPLEKKPKRLALRGGVFRYLALGLVLLLGIVAWFVFSASSVRLVIEPTPDRVSLTGALFPFTLAGRYLLLPGNYTVSVEKKGFHEIRQNIVVTDVAQQTFTLNLEKLPGLLSINTAPQTSAKVFVDGIEMGNAPLLALELSPGTHLIEAKAERYFDYRSEIEIEGAQRSQDLQIDLVPAWAPIFFDSHPQAAEISVDNEILGVTPLSAELLQGQHEVRMTLLGYKAWQDTLSVTAQVPQTLPKVVLEKADGTIVLQTHPQGANVTLNGRYQGQTPLELTLAPDEDYRLKLSKAGYRSITRELKAEPDKTQRLDIRLQANLGFITLDVEPVDAQVFVDGVRYKEPTKGLRLTTVPHRLEIKKQGYVPKTVTVTPRKGFAQEISVRLKTLTQHEAELIPLKITSAAGQELRLVKPGRFNMGASRREQGRRANEMKYTVELTRAFYIGTMEVTNAQFRLFRPSHSSGLVKNISLDIDEQPVVRVSWEQAARYCNWLSRKESLPPVYLEKNGKLSAIRPLPKGYRLPTEAEWAWVARYAGTKKSMRYPWGNAMPPKARTANLADTNARPFLSNILEGYDDGFAATAPVGSFSPNPLGLFDLGGNVAEWVHDLYSFGPESPLITQTDPVGPAQGRFHVIRGSGWMHANIGELRFSYRDYGDKARPDLGFRIARYAEE